jgi:Winged helix DNA-binding domain
MSQDALLATRLANQLLAAPSPGSPAEVVAHLGAVQAQEYGQCLWALALRSTQRSREQIEAAIAGRQILRTWPMRGTIHLVPSQDARWMVNLLAPRKVRQMTNVYEKIGLTRAVLSRAGDVVAATLAGGKRVQRKDLYAILTQHGIDCSASPNGSRGGHILTYLSMLGQICLGPLDGRQATFVLLDDWVPRSRTPAEPLAELATRYFTSHGPATARDFGWWSGLTLTEVRQSIELAGRSLRSVQVEGEEYWRAAGEAPRPEPLAGAYLLPAFDEYTVAYRDRTALFGNRELSQSDMLNPLMVLDGRAVGVWRATSSKAVCTITLAPFDGVSGAELKQFDEPCADYSTFLHLGVEVVHGDYRQVRRMRAQ